MERHNSTNLFLNILLMAVISLSLFACSNEAPKEGIEVTDAWVRKMPPGMTNTAAFMTIKNYTGAPVTLTGVSMDKAGHVMMHESKVVEGMAKMEHLGQVVIEKEVSFEPGAKHVMIMGLDMSDGAKTYNIRLHFANKPSLDVAAEVRDANQ
ncbi:copper chaperone PCu(A)C [Kangiella sp. HD9-110m-PIT-SAG07]|nr:copper chaperone PCu(A)C [Kangiella sp. HD9-110m-PIT-SAG07]